MEKYRDMHALLSSSSQAKQYFDSLPDYVRVNTFENLRDYAENLLRGDQ